MILIICIVNLGIYCDQDLLAAHLGRWEGLKKTPHPNFWEVLKTGWICCGSELATR